MESAGSLPHFAHTTCHHHHQATAPQRHSFIMRTPRLLPQEHLLWKLGAVLQSTSQPVAGALYLTNFQLIFSPFRSVGIHTASLLQSVLRPASMRCCLQSW